jgi:hypothetical protein
MSETTTELPKTLQRRLLPQREDFDVTDLSQFSALTTPLVEVDYSTGEGKVNTMIGDTSLSYSYRKITAADLGDSSADISKEDVDEYRNYLIIDGLVLQKGSLARVDVDELLPQSTLYYLQDGGSAGGTAYRDRNAAVIENISPNTPLGLLLLFHELGHLNEKNRIRTAEKFVSDITQDSSKTNELDPLMVYALIADERNAWAWGLSKLKPFIGDTSSHLFPKKQTMQMVHQWAMQSYSNRIYKDLGQQLTAENIGLYTRPRPMTQSESEDFNNDPIWDDPIWETQERK